MSKSKVLIAVSCTLAFLIAYAVSRDKQSVSDSINSFESCVEAGNPVLESYPRQCKADKKMFVENIGNTLEKRNIIVLDSPQPNQVVSNPITLTGRARGPWYFEASFPAVIFDANGKSLGSFPVVAQDEWMTEGFVPFKATFKFIKPTTKTGTLVLKKDNPSGDPARDEELRIPIKFE